MNLTNKDYFTFNVNNSALVVGQTASGKTELVRTYMRRLEKAYKPGEMKYVIFDLKQVEFSIDIDDGAKEEYLYAPVLTDPKEGIKLLVELADLVYERAEANPDGKSKPKPFIFIYIEECEMAYEDPEKFVDSVVKINKFAEKANVKLIYSTSRVSDPIAVPKELLKSFELLLCGVISIDDSKYPGVPNYQLNSPGMIQYDFVLYEQKANESMLWTYFIDG